MPLNGMILKAGATSIAPTGGSDMTFQVDGQTVNNGIHVSNVAQADFRIRENLTIKYRLPKQNADRTWSKGKWSVTYAEPSVDSTTGAMKYAVGRVELELDPSETAATNQNIRFMLAQTLIDADLANYWNVGSLT